MRTMDHVKKRIIISMSAIIVLILTLLGITYAYFISNVKGNEEEKSISATAGILKLKYDGNNSYVKVTGLEPGTTIESKTFSVENTGTGIIENYDVILENVVNELENYEDLTYVLECTSNDEYECTGSEGVFPTNQEVIATNTIDVGTIHSYILTLTYKETYEDQSDDMNKEISAKVNIKHDALNMKNLKIYGNSLQDTLTYGEITSTNPVEIENLGEIVNILNIDAEREIITGSIPNDDFKVKDSVLSFTSNYFNLETNKFGLKFKVEKNTNYKLSYTTITGRSNNRIYDLEGNSIGGSNLSGHSFNSGDNEYLIWQMSSNEWGLYTELTDIMITEVTADTTYVPYGKYKVPITIQGKNLFDEKLLAQEEGYNTYENGVWTTSNLSSYGRSILYNVSGINHVIDKNKVVKVTPNTKISIKFYDYVNNGVSGTYNLYCSFYDSEGEQITYTAFNPNSIYTTNVPENAYYLDFIRTTNSGTLSFSHIQIEEGDTATEYEEYSEQVHNIYLNEPLRKVGDYVDYIDFKNKTVVRNVKEIALSGQENWMLQSTNSYGITNFFTDAVGDINSTTYLSNRFVQQNSTIANTETEGLFYANKSTFYIRFNSSTAANVTAFKNWLSNNDTKLYVQLKTPVVETINLPVLYINKDKNISVCDSNVCASNVEVEFYE